MSAKADESTLPLKEILKPTGFIAPDSLKDMNFGELKELVENGGNSSSGGSSGGDITNPTLTGTWYCWSRTEQNSGWFDYPVIYTKSLEGDTSRMVDVYRLEGNQMIQLDLNRSNINTDGTLNYYQDKYERSSSYDINI